jgi:HAD superfamily hydrolase (TIGR01490 family)
MNEIHGIAIFDFDGTLVKSDSFLPFLAFLTSWPRVIATLLTAFVLYALRVVINRNDPALADARTFIKSYLMKHILAGRPVMQITPALEKLSRWQVWNEEVRALLLDHQAKGHKIVVASGGLDLYLPELLKSLPPHDLICTTVGLKDGVTTGEMVNGNCVRARKAELVAEYLAKHGPFDASWGYGNAPHDLPMLALVKFATVV